MDLSVLVMPRRLATIARAHPPSPHKPRDRNTDTGDLGTGPETAQIGMILQAVPAEKLDDTVADLTVWFSLQKPRRLPGDQLVVGHDERPVAEDV